MNELQLPGDFIFPFQFLFGDKDKTDWESLDWLFYFLCSLAVSPTAFGIRTLVFETLSFYMIY